MDNPQWIHLLIGVCSCCCCVGPFAISVVFPVPLSREMGVVPGVFGRSDLAALVQAHLKSLFVVWSFVCTLSCVMGDEGGGAQNLP